MSGGAYPVDRVLDPVAIVDWAIDTGLYDIAYSAWGWPLAEIVHFSGLCLLAGSVLLFDLRALGLLRPIPLASLHRLVLLGVLGFALNLASGTLFVASAPDQYLYNPAFQVKLALMALAGANMLAFYALTKGGRRLTDAAGIVRTRVRACALLSLVCWTGVIAAGRVITAFRPPGWFWCAWCG